MRRMLLRRGHRPRRGGRHLCPEGRRARVPRPRPGRVQPHRRSGIGLPRAPALPARPLPAGRARLPDGAAGDARRGRRSSIGVCPGAVRRGAAGVVQAPGPGDPSPRAHRRGERHRPPRRRVPDHQLDRPLGRGRLRADRQVRRRRAGRRSPLRGGPRGGAVCADVLLLRHVPHHRPTTASAADGPGRQPSSAWKAVGTAAGVRCRPPVRRPPLRR
mmetsp:Transcript_72897/g.202062  ORF Transcript_72897/g.202062 Transcript_72897/m.202062 type:complete len:216 (-) Transcript_72897:186-833(-)